MSSSNTIDVGTGFPLGLDFRYRSEFLDVSLVRELLQEIRRVFAVPSAIVYVLHLKVENDTSRFEPYAETGMPTTPVSLPKTIDTKRIAGLHEEWPLIAYSKGFSDGCAITDEILRNAPWHGKIRLLVDREYVGYCKIVIPNGDAIPSPEEFLDCFRQAAVFLREQLDSRQAARTLLSRELAATNDKIDSALEAGDPVAGLRHLLTLITSHFGANINRIACFGRRQGDGLECLHAHGGDGTPAWADLQRVIGDLDKLEDLHSLAKHETDPYYRAMLTPAPFQIALNEPNCLLAGVWRKNCDLDWLPAGSALEYRETNFAARFTDENEWARRVAGQDGSGVIFASQNHQHFVLPWLGSHRPIGVVLCDFANWADINIWNEAVPRLLRARALLAHFTQKFETAAFGGWARPPSGVTKC